MSKKKNQPQYKDVNLPMVNKFLKDEQIDLPQITKQDNVDATHALLIMDLYEYCNAQQEQLEELQNKIKELT
tara:strand:- start:255 stop:470 length:216 start_codon:yes stop_codon:yes gene_type:complete